MSITFYIIRQYKKRICLINIVFAGQQKTNYRLDSIFNNPITLDLNYFFMKKFIQKNLLFLSQD